MADKGLGVGRRGGEGQGKGPRDWEPGGGGEEAGGGVPGVGRKPCIKLTKDDDNPCV